MLLPWWGDATHWYNGTLWSHNERQDEIGWLFYTEQVIANEWYKDSYQSVNDTLPYQCWPLHDYLSPSRSLSHSASPPPPLSFSAPLYLSLPVTPPLSLLHPLSYTPFCPSLQSLRMFSFIMTWVIRLIWNNHAYPCIIICTCNTFEGSIIV